MHPFETSKLSRKQAVIPEDLKASHDTIPWRAIADIGNILRHGYDRINEGVVWNTIRGDLPPLKDAILSMIRKIEG